MTTRKAGLAAAVLAFAALSIGTNDAGAAISARDQMTKNPMLAERHLGTIAILPAVAVNGDEQAERWVEEGWRLIYRQAESSWLSAGDVRARLALAADGSDGLLESARSEVWSSGEAQATTARALAGSLGADAVLTLRVDRWEIVDGGRAMVELTATLTGADGARLWRATGLAGHGRVPGSRDRSFSADLDWIRPPEAEPQDPENRLALALCTLYERWSVGLPVALLPEAAEAPIVAAHD